MGIVLWVGLFVGLTGLAGWIVLGDGADRVEGLTGAILLGADPNWSEEGIRLFVGAVWVVLAVWFVVGLFSPGARLGLW